jgi:DNA-binding MarR family transcriptional regulator
LGTAAGCGGSSRSPGRPAGNEHPASLEEDCGEIERCLLILARFTSGRRHHAQSLATAGVGKLETAAERRARHELARRRRARDPEYTWCNDPLAAAAPVSGHGATQVDAGLYPVLAVIEDLHRARPVDVARALTLDRSTVARHLDTLECRGLVFRERGVVRDLLPRVGLTVTGFNAVAAIRGARVRRLAVSLAGEPQLERRLIVLCLGRLAEALHGDVSQGPLPRELRDPRRRASDGLTPYSFPAKAGRLGRRRYERTGAPRQANGQSPTGDPPSAQYTSGTNVWESIGGRT